MKTTAKTPASETPTAVAHAGAKGKAFPAVPVSQQKPDDQNDLLMQMKTAPTALPFTAFNAPNAPVAGNQSSYPPFVAPVAQRQTPSPGPTPFAPDSRPLQMQSGPGASGQVVQMVKASELEAIGKQWHKEIWVRADSSKKAEMIRAIETETGFKSGTVFQAYDLYIRGAGPSAYKDIVKTLVKKDAETFLSFLNDEVEFENLGGNLPKLAVIVCVSETGRGYSIEEMKAFMEKIIAGETTWSGVKENYAPSLTYKEDAFGKVGEYTGMDEAEDQGEEMEEVDEEAISDDEATEMRQGSAAAGPGGVTRAGTAFK